MNSRNEDHRLKVCITHHGRSTENIMCEVLLPKRIIEPVELIFRPTSDQSNQLGYPFEFSIYGEIKDYSGELKSIIKANRVYYKQGHIKRWGNELSESWFIGEPVDLKITHFFKTNEKPEDKNTSIKGVFWLTPSIMLSTGKSLLRSYTGEVTVNYVSNFEFVLSNRSHLKFDDYYKHLDNDNGEMVSFSELVAEFKIDNQNGEIDISFEPIDDFLMLTSFCARQRCVCLGWEVYEHSKITKFYRRDITIPEIKKHHSFNDTLVDMKDFKDFIKIAFNSFVQTEQKELLRQSVYGAMVRENGTIESNYMTLYSALETLTLLHRQNQELEFIIPPKEWAAFRNDLKNFIKSHPQFSENKDMRKLIYNKLPELNRISFSTAFANFCGHYNIDLQDLWPIVDQKDGISLSNIRNKLVHGVTFGRRQNRALIVAALHLEWVLDRSILSVLGWQYSNSKVSKRFLSKMKPYKEWHEDRKILSEWC